MTQYETPEHRAETAKSYDELLSAIDDLLVLAVAEEIVEAEATR